MFFNIYQFLHFKICGLFLHLLNTKSKVIFFFDMLTWKVKVRNISGSYLWATNTNLKTILAFKYLWFLPSPSKHLRHLSKQDFRENIFLFGIFCSFSKSQPKFSLLCWQRKASFPLLEIYSFLKSQFIFLFDVLTWKAKTPPLLLLCLMGEHIFPSHPHLSFSTRFLYFWIELDF